MTDQDVTKLIDQAEELIGMGAPQEHLLELLDEAEKLLPADVSVLCKSARILFRYGILHGKGRFFFLALDKLKEAEEKNPLFLDKTPVWWQLWGNILIQLGKRLDNALFYEMALTKYEKALKVEDEVEVDLFWDLADAWTLLGQKSGEPTDFQQALSYFYKGHELGIRSPFFQLDYAGSLSHYGNLIGDPQVIEEALNLYQEILSEPIPREQEPSLAYVVAWRKFALAQKARFQLCHQKEAFEDSDTAFHEAILISPKNGDLWLDWGELYLQAGWLKRDIKLVEIGLEKLTSTKAKECDPIRLSCLLGLGLTYFGLFLENLKLIKDGEERLRIALEAAPHPSDLLFALAFAEFGIGLYFSDEKIFSKSAALFERGLQKDATSDQHLHALFQCYMAWGLYQNECHLVQKGIKMIGRLSELRPHSPIYLNEWGVALLRSRHFEKTKEGCQACIEEAIDKFRKASEFSEEDDSLYNWGCALDLLGDLTADEEDYSKAIDLLTRVFEKKHNELHVRYHLGLAFSHLGELTLNADCLSQAVELLESVVKVEQEDENIWCELGYALLNLSELIADSSYPEEGEKRRHEAERALLKAAELGNGDSCYHLACLYSLSGFYESSMHYLRRAQASDCLPSKLDLEHDEWLEGVRKTEAFQEFLTAQGENG